MPAIKADRNTLPVPRSLVIMLERFAAILKALFADIATRFGVKKTELVKLAILPMAKTVYECMDDGENWHCYGFYFQLDRQIAGEPVVCFIGDPQKLAGMYDFCARTKIKIDDREYLLPLGLRVKGIWRPWDRPEIPIPAAIGEIALTAELLSRSALDAFLAKIELETEVKNLHYKHSAAKVAEIESAIKSIDEQLELFAVNLGELFHRIVRERTLSSDLEFEVRHPHELARRNEDLKQLLTQFHQLDR